MPTEEVEALRAAPGDATFRDVLALIEEIDRLAGALTDAADRLGDLSSVLSRSNRNNYAVRAWEWSKEARSVLLD